MDWSSHGYGYLLYADAPKHGVLIGLNSKGKSSETSSSFLGEIKALCRALLDAKRQVAGQRLGVWTDSERAFLRIGRHQVDEKKLLGVRISCLLACIWSNFSGQMEIRYLPGEHNRGADVLSRWKVEVECDSA